MCGLRNEDHEGEDLEMQNGDTDTNDNLLCKVEHFIDEQKEEENNKNGLGEVFSDLATGPLQLFQLSAQIYAGEYFGDSDRRHHKVGH